MPLPSAAIERHLIGDARHRAEQLLVIFAAATAPDEPVSVLCERASATFDDYCAELLEGLLAGVVPVDDAENEWVRAHYIPLAITFATAIRDAISDPACRHAAAQAIQCRILEHERHLRMVLDSHAGPHESTPTPSIRDGADPLAVQEPSAER